MIRFAFGMGALIVPEIAQPFLKDPPPEVMPERNYSTVILVPTRTSQNIDYRTEVVMPPYSIVAAVTFFCAIVHIISYFFVPLTITFQEREKVTIKKMLNPASCAPGSSRILAVPFLTLLSVLWALSICLESIIYGRFLFTYAISDSVNFTIAAATIR